MRLRSLILSLVFTFIIGVSVVYLRPYFVEWYMPAFTREEATAMVGRRVRNVYWTDRFAGSKCPQNGGACAEVKVEERGTVIGIEEVTPNKYFFVVRWDEPSQGERMLSYFGRTTRRVFLEVE